MVNVNLVSAYAWCNVHDIIWGVKGDSRPETLPSVRVSHGVEIPDVDVQKEIDPQTGDLILHNFGDYVNTLDGLLDSNLDQCQEERILEMPTRDTATKQEDMYRNFRSLTVFLWLFLNSFLVMLIINIPTFSIFRPTASGGEGLLYVGSVLWAYAGITAFQYLCTVLYALQNLWTWITTGLRRRRLVRPDKDKDEDEDDDRDRYEQDV